MFVAKWRDGPGMDADAFLATLRAQGSTLVARRFGKDVNVRVVRSEAALVNGKRSSPPSPKPAH